MHRFFFFDGMRKGENWGGGVEWGWVGATWAMQSEALKI